MFEIELEATDDIIKWWKLLQYTIKYSIPYFLRKRYKYKHADDIYDLLSTYNTFEYKKNTDVLKPFKFKLRITKKDYINYITHRLTGKCKNL